MIDTHLHLHLHPSLRVIYEFKILIKMFRSITENPNKPVGKFADHKSMHGKATHYNVGEDNEMVGAQSTLQSSFINYGAVSRRARCDPPATQVNLGDFKTEYNSNSMRSYH